uniref:Uncharacterized protein n=1 Tax=Myoviridae sp. ctLnO19 TaxID=2825085 RepID=A0A8S5P1K0_9CAUD|nr:MAG TPA: hypothetical protein [Myoviridae sp. ctLnO19]DAJ69111.1 MAG TPA: hypothetical protein [Caudoviricetes sp.]
MPTVLQSYQHRLRKNAVSRRKNIISGTLYYSVIRIVESSRVAKRHYSLLPITPQWVVGSNE